MRSTLFAIAATLALGTAAQAAPADNVTFEAPELGACCVIEPWAE